MSKLNKSFHDRTSLKYRQRTIITRNFANYSQDDYFVDMNSAPWTQVFRQNNVNDAWQQMKTIMLNIMNKHAPLAQRRIKGRSCPWLNRHFKKAMNNRDYHLRKTRRTRAEVNWSMYKRLPNRVNCLIDKAKQSYNKNLLIENANDPKRFWKAIKSIFPTKRGDRSSTSGRWHNN